MVKKIVQVNQKSVLLQAWDTAGQERFHSITQAYFRGAFGAIICYDATCEQSLENAINWVKEFKERS